MSLFLKMDCILQMRAGRTSCDGDDVRDRFHVDRFKNVCTSESRVLGEDSTA